MLSTVDTRAATLRRQASVCFAHWAGRDPAEVKQYEIGGLRLTIRFHDPRLVPLNHRPLAHLERSPDQAAESQSSADLTVDAFVAQRPPIELSNDEWMQASILWKSTPVDVDKTFVHFTAGGQGRLTLLLGAARRAAVCFRDPDMAPAWDAATPLRELFQAFFRLHDGHVVHGALIGDDHGSVLLAGVGGSGKSSTSLTCLQHSDLTYLGDDLCLIRRLSDGRYHGFSLYSSAKLRPEDLARFAALQLPQHDDSHRGDGKPTFFLHPAMADRLGRGRPLKAVLLPRVEPREDTTSSPASAGEAWKAVSPSTACLLPMDDHGWSWLSEFINLAPARRLSLGSNRMLIPQVVRAELSREGDAWRKSAA